MQAESGCRSCRAAWDDSVGMLLRANRVISLFSCCAVFPLLAKLADRNTASVRRTPTRTLTRPAQPLCPAGQGGASPHHDCQPPRRWRLLLHRGQGERGQGHAAGQEARGELHLLRRRRLSASPGQLPSVLLSGLSPPMPPATSAAGDSSRPRYERLLRTRSGRQRRPALWDSGKRHLAQPHFSSECTMLSGLPSACCPDQRCGLALILWCTHTLLLHPNGCISLLTPLLPRRFLVPSQPQMLLFATFLSCPQSVSMTGKPL